MDESTLDVFATLFKKVAHFAAFAHAPQASGEWEWVKHHARMFMGAPPEASFDRRGVSGGMAGAFDRARIAMGRAKYALRWPLYLRADFITLRQDLSARRTTIFG